MENELDSEKYFVLTPKQKRKSFLIGVLLFLIIFPPIFYAYYKFAVFRPSQTDKEATIEIGKGDSVFEVADMLSQKDAINSDFLFILYVLLNRKDTSIQAGTYTIKAGTNLVDLVAQLGHGTNDLKLVFLEGWRVEEFARLASENLQKIDYGKFVDMAAPYEGYLFPDTYFLSIDTQEEELIELFMDTFDQKTKEILTEENLAKAGLTKEQAVVFASLVEREVSNEEDRKIVAGILIKRWQEGVKLDVDASTQYAIAYKRLCPVSITTACAPTYEDIIEFSWWPNELSSEEISFESPYNTRLKVGLPPTPISSVSVSALEAVINYEKTPYYYYLTDSNGVTHYAVTLQGHSNNIKEFLTN